MILTYKYRIKDRSAKNALRRYALAVNQVWNYCVAYQRDTEARYKAGAPKRRWASTYELHKLTSGTSHELGIRSETINEVCRFFVQTRKLAKRSPKFRNSFGVRRSLGWIPFKTDTYQVSGNCISYRDKMFRFWLGNRPVPAETKTGCFVEDARGRWYVCFQVEVAEKPNGGAKQVGIDLGLKALATCSDGFAIEAPQIYRKYEQRLAIAQRAKNKKRVRALHAKIANCRKDFIHKATTALARNHALIAVGNVNSKKLARTRMAKSVLDAGWSTFRSQLHYKSQQAGAVYLEVDEKFTTQVCHSCGVISDSSPKGRDGLGMRSWTCGECGESHDRDVNAARNILMIALSAQRLVGGSHSIGYARVPVSGTH